MTAVSAAVVDGPGAPFVIRELELADPQPGEVLVRMVAAGLCHTDLGVQAGGIPFPLPGVLGHEGAGVIEQLGDPGSGLHVGQKVLLSFTSCGHCGGCRDGHPAHCDTWVPRNLLQGRRDDGTATIHDNGAEIGGRFFGQSSFATHAIADARSVVPVPDAAPLEVLAPLGCGVQTGFGTVWRILRPEPGSTVAVFGAGGVGLSAVMAADLLPLRRVIAIDLSPSRLAVARELGATDTIDARNGDAEEQLSALTGGRGVDHALETTGNPQVLEAAIRGLGIGGACAVIGAPPLGTTASFDVQGILPGKRIVGVTLGDGDPQTLLPLLVELHGRGRLPLERIIRHYPLAEIDAAANDMHSGVTIKPVITFA
jgi:aryl-alcohol dehydrogenase